MARPSIVVAAAAPASREAAEAHRHDNERRAMVPGERESRSKGEQPHSGPISAAAAAASSLAGWRPSAPPLCDLL